MTVNWKYLSSFISHEMYKRISTLILSAVNKKNINNYDMTEKTIKQILEYLTQIAKLEQKQREYVERLIKQSPLIIHPNCMYIY